MPWHASDVRRPLSVIGCRARMGGFPLVIGMMFMIIPDVAHGEVMDKEPTAGSIWAWAILGGVVVARCWAIRSALAWPVTLSLAAIFAGFWVEVSTGSVGAAIRAEAGSGYLWSLGLATAFAAGLPFVGLLVRRLSTRRRWRRFLRWNDKRMTGADFEAVKDLLSQQGQVIDKARYESRSFGSWTVQVSARPPLRLVWDGKEQWLMVQQETDEVRAGVRVWKTLWSAESQSKRNPEDAVAALLAQIGAA